MKKNIFTVLIILLSVSFSFSQEYIFKFKVENKNELKKLTHQISIDNYQNGEVTAYANQKEFEKFKTLGYEFELIPHPATGKVINMATTTAQMANWDRYPTYEVFVQMMNDFATNYPDLCELVTIGESEDGRELLALRITDNLSDNEQEPEFFYTGTMHGDETTGFVLLLRLADYLLSNYGTDAEVTNLVNNIDIYINPAANPDGTYAGGNSTVSGATRSNSNYVDLNREFPTPNYQSPSGVNESEIQAMMDFSDNHHFVMSANIHGGIELVNYPWDSWYSNDNSHADHNWFEHISYDYANAAHDNSPSGYFMGQGDGVTHGADWYLVDGSRQDYMTYFKHCREVTLEISDEKTLSSDELPAHWTYNKESLLGYMNECLYGINGTVKNIASEPLDAKIEIIGYDKDNSEVYTSTDLGDYYRPIAPGTYDVTYSSEGYISQTHTLTVLDWQTTLENNVVLLQAEQISLSGIVTDQETGLPIENAQISFLETSINDIYTNNLGQYSITISEGDYQIQAYKTGYSPSIKTETISSDNNVVDFELSLSQAITFEGSIPCEFDYTGNPSWFQANDQSFEGAYSMKSGGISDGGSTILTLNVNTDAGYIQFYKKVSSESGYDYLKFSIDGNQQDEWSGDIDWTQESYSISAGMHTFAWEYMKDGSVSSNSDCAWIDNIEIPNGDFVNYTLTFEIKNGDTPIENSNITLENNGTKVTNDLGIAEFNELCPESFDYTVVTTGYENVTGNITLEGNETIIIDYLASDTHDVKLELIKIYPNPSTGDFVIDFSHTKKTGEITIYDIAGKEILKKTTDKGFANINLGEQKAGVYFIKINIDNEIFNTKIILQ